MISIALIVVEWGCSGTTEGIRQCFLFLENLPGMGRSPPPPNYSNLHKILCVSFSKWCPKGHYKESKSHSSLGLTEIFISNNLRTKKYSDNFKYRKTKSFSIRSIRSALRIWVFSEIIKHFHVRTTYLSSHFWDHIYLRECICLHAHLYVAQAVSRQSQQKGKKEHLSHQVTLPQFLFLSRAPLSY